MTSEPTGNKGISQFRPQLKQIVNSDTCEAYLTQTAVVMKPFSTIYIYAPDGKLICKVSSSPVVRVRSGICVDKEKLYNLSEYNCFENEGEIISPSQG